MRYKKILFISTYSKYYPVSIVLPYRELYIPVVAGLHGFSYDSSANIYSFVIWPHEDLWGSLTWLLSNLM